jgi:plastocyanin
VTIRAGRDNFEPGDIVRFVRTGIVPHNVQTKDTPAEADFGPTVVGPIPIQKGDTHEREIDDHFAAGSTNTCARHTSPSESSRNSTSWWTTHRSAI